MSTYNLPHDPEASTATTQKPVDPAGLTSNNDKAEAEWKDGTNTDFSIATGKVTNLNTANGSANNIGESGETTFAGNISGVDNAGQIDTYEFPLSFPFVADNIQNLAIDYTGNITEIVAYFLDYTSGNLNVDIENSGTVVKTGGTYTFATLNGTEASPTVLSDPSTGAVATTRKSLSLSIKTDNSLVATGLIIKLRITRT